MKKIKYGRQITHFMAGEMWSETVCGPEYDVEICCTEITYLDTL
jgi:hypothetical protein